MNDNHPCGCDLVSSWPFEKLIIEVDWQNDQFRFLKEIARPQRRLAAVRPPIPDADPFKPKPSEDKSC
jgi:hypothetical protein